MSRTRAATYALAWILAAAAVPTEAIASAPRLKGSTLQVGGATIGRGYRAAVGLPDGSAVAIRETGKRVDSDFGPVDPCEVVRVSGDGAVRVLFEGRAREDRLDTLVDMSALALAPDGKAVFVFSSTVTMDLGVVWRVDVASGAARFLSPGGLPPAVVQSGGWKGHLVTTRKLPLADGGAWFPAVLLDPVSGELRGVCERIPAGSESLEAEMVPLVPLDKLKLDRKLPRKR